MMYSFYKEIILKIREMSEKTPCLLIAIDGRCASGKTSLAGYLADELGCNLFHTDDFFLPPSLRTPVRLNEPGGNTDFERLKNEILLPIKNGGKISYRRYMCAAQSFSEPVDALPNPVNIVEGSYSCHPENAFLYDLKIFLTVQPDEQLRRLRQRDMNKLDDFISKWIPLEELYFNSFNIQSSCDMVY